MVHLPPSLSLAMQTRSRRTPATATTSTTTSTTTSSSSSSSAGSSVSHEAPAVHPPEADGAATIALPAQLLRGQPKSKRFWKASETQSVALQHR